jgi:hypothetical protein
MRRRYQILETNIIRIPGAAVTPAHAPGHPAHRFDRCHLAIIVIASASEAIQSRRGKGWIASSLSLLAMTENLVRRTEQVRQALVRPGMTRQRHHRRDRLSGCDGNDEEREGPG